MSQVTKDEITKIARLSRIEIEDSKKEELAAQVGKIINWVGELNEVNTDGVEPLCNVHDSVLRLNKDEVSDGNIAGDVLKNATDAKYNYFTVPKVIE
jgi:aspartyl-tRNA(Asn)/glutamyl-tRNA(Gln) amidotransferase subunit C